ncbi:neural cell adhesion molecule 1-B-like [Daphnia carinata]|uniref:neural cell adhesion molecule 1-B-like n=1 Tax=Daphnia carinata TaxID=120202 RepID=UPI00257A6572|nr:neural cell adhesion molecule 1-B-like [Daphnia carinata]
MFPIGCTFALSWILLAGLISGEQSAGASIWLAPSNPTVAVFANQSYFVSCKAPGAEKIVWTKTGEGDITPTSGKIHVEEKEDGMDLVFETIRKKNQGEYACKATVRGQEVEKKINLTVFKPLSFGETAEVQYATEGSDFTIRCDVGGDPVVTATWKVRGRSLRPSPRHKVIDNNLSIKEVTLDDGGLYVCRATQSNPMIADFREMNITLKIQHEPRWFKDHTKEAYGFIGGTVNMTCSAVAEPGADFIWIKDNKTLQPSDDVQIFNSDHHSSLQLYIYDDSVFGDYECRATNMLGTMARVIVLEQATKPAAPTFKIKITHPDSFVLEIEDSDVVSDRGQDAAARNPMDVTGYVVQYKQPSLEWSRAQEREFERMPSQPYRVTGMQQDTSYEVRVAARTAAGTGDFTDVQVEKTKKIVAAAVPVLNSAQQLVLCHSLLTLLIAALASANIYI